MTGYRVVFGLWLLLYVGLSGVAASSWRDEPEARLQLHQQGLELALADVHPTLTLWWRQAVSVDTASDEADDRLLLGMQAFWRYWASLSFVDRQYLRTTDAFLSFREQDHLELQLAAEQQRRYVLVQGLAPGYANHDQLQQQLARLLALNVQPWPALRTATLRPGVRGKVISRIRERLGLLGDIPVAGAPSLPDVDDTVYAPADAFHAPEIHDPEIHDPEIHDPEIYDAGLEQGIRDFQRRHGLQVDGVIGPQTFAWLDMTPLRRAQLLMRSMLRTLIGDKLPSSYLLVNIPEYRLRLYQDQVVVLESDVIVGKDERKTPIMASNITHVVLNPPWNVPRSIIEKDIVPRLYRDPGYLEREGFEVLDGAGRVSRAEWQARLYNGGGFPYRLRQQPGSRNALGAYKFHLPNDDAIYLHDTPVRHLFSRESRALSSGCVRVAGAEQLADWLLSDQMSLERLTALKASGVTRWLPVARPLPVFMVYWPGWLGPDGWPRFRNDIYDFDRTLHNPFTAG
ncbi:murein L,D-transpeptidase YcbB/YkuD [Oceanisphaera litoralis]|uniref:L,D-transpeptidase family protein n=1 Tax=Oceanisphaera litoralis TaxID=225144 RepID=UPI00195BDFE0|nr:L,D-transpeptidase family protein [Oceanisphaera litoralis]MBM7454414.1 murein L,D-transpeptidase YcbB/YkuD [Oceanisphaera litoralis]